MQVIRCKDARAQGLVRYFTGKPCKRGHVAERHVNGGCLVCSREDQARYYHNDPEKHLSANRAYFQQSEVRERNRVRQAGLYKLNPELFRSISARCRAARLLRVPAWSETDSIREFYAACPPGHEVDHEVPLLGENVSGLHVLANLQYLPRAENRAKRNRAKRNRF